MNLINTKKSTRYPGLFVRKYNRKVFYKNLWHTDPNLVESRGHVVDSNGNLVVNPPTKVFNYLENGTTIAHEEHCLCIDKINGFLACLTYNKDLDEVLVSTTGSLDSTFCDMARDYLSYAITAVHDLKLPTTFFFEIVHHDDPHIIKENIGAYLIGKRDLDSTSSYTTSYENEIALDHYANAFRVARPHWCLTWFSDILQGLKHIQHEGFMVYGLHSGTVLKLKSPYYLSLKAIARKSDILSLNHSRVDEEYYPLLDHIKSISEKFTTLTEQEKLTYIRNYLENYHV